MAIKLTRRLTPEGPRVCVGAMTDRPSYGESRGHGGSQYMDTCPTSEAWSTHPGTCDDCIDSGRHEAEERAPPPDPPP